MIEKSVKDELSAMLGDGICFDADTSRMTSLRVGGPADAVATPADRSELSALLRACTRYRIPHRTIGRGFNTIVRDEGIDGVLIQLANLKRLEERPDGALRVEAGVSHATLTRFCQDRGLAGLEFGAGIPGCIGGWLAMNAGVPDRETKDAVLEVEVMSPTGRRRRHLLRQGLDFRYRSLRGLAEGSVLLSALLRVKHAKRDVVKAEIARHLAKRAGTQPLDQPSCGSVFRNPRRGHAGRLIEAAGLKGERRGGARISTVHANFIVNEGGATAADVLALIGQARATVRMRTGIELEPEVRIWGREQ